MKTALPTCLAAALLTILAMQMGTAQAQIDPFKQHLNPAAGNDHPGGPQQGVCIGAGCNRLQPVQNNAVLPVTTTPSNCPGGVPGVELPPGPCKSTATAR